MPVCKHPHDDIEHRTIAWFSCGAASASAAKIAVENCANVVVVYCDLRRDEHPDNTRFLKDIERWLGVPVTVVQSQKYFSIEDVWTDRNYMAGIAGAPCTIEMKKVPRFAFQQWNDVHVFGMTVNEVSRMNQIEDNNPELMLWWPLERRGFDKQDCYRMIYSAGIRLPEMYMLGYRNNNCIGCVKASSIGYWAKVRADFPDVFQRRAIQSREIGARLTRYKGQRIFLDEIPAEDFPYKAENLSCGPECADIES